MSDEGAVLRRGLRLGSYHVHERIGGGGMGSIYRAHDTNLKRDVALKVLSEPFIEDPDRLARFKREAQILAALNHPNIGAIYGIEQTSEGHLVLILELIEGITLAGRITRGPLPPLEALAIARQIALALEAAHEGGIIHRDLKPDNIRLKSDGTIKVLDFGIAKALDPRPGSQGANATTTTRWPTITMPGVVLGTAAYVSPEQARGDVIDQRTDIWAFGVILFEMLTGTRPFAGDSIPEVLVKVLEHEPDLDLLPATTTPSTRRLIRRCLQKDVGARIRHVADARLEIEDSLAEGAPDPSATTASGAAQPTPLSLVRAIIKSLFNVGGASVAMLLVPFMFAAVGYVTSVTFNQALRIRSSEGFLDYFVFGYRAMFGPAVLMSLGALMLILGIALVGVLARLGRVAWPTNPLLRTGSSLIDLVHRWLTGREPRTLGQGFSLLCGLALVLYTAVSWKLLSVIIQLVANGPAAGVDTSVLSLSERPYVYRVAQIGVVLVFGLFTIWLSLFPWLQRRGANRLMVHVFRLRSVAAILSILLMLTAPWRLAWNSLREPVSFDGRPAFVLTEDASRVVIYVPGTMPFEISPHDPKLERPNPSQLQVIFP